MHIIHLFKLCYEKRDIVFGLIKREFYAKYAGSLLWLVWAYLIPIFQIGIYFLIFGIILKSPLKEISGSDHYYLWLLSGMLPWFYFAEIVMAGSTSLIRYSNLIKRTGFPIDVISISIFFSACIKHLIAVIGFFIFLPFIDIPYNIRMLEFILIFISLTFFALGLSYFLSIIAIVLKDLGHALPIILNFWFFLTPAVYSEKLIENRFILTYIIKYLNPMTFPVTFYRDVITGNQNIDSIATLVFLVISIITFYGGYYIFYKTKNYVPDLV